MSKTYKAPAPNIDHDNDVEWVRVEGVVYHGDTFEATRTLNVTYIVLDHAFVQANWDVEHTWSDNTDALLEWSRIGGGGSSDYSITFEFSKQVWASDNGTWWSCEAICTARDMRFTNNLLGLGEVTDSDSGTACVKIGGDGDFEVVMPPVTGCFYLYDGACFDVNTTSTMWFEWHCTSTNSLLEFVVNIEPGDQEDLPAEEAGSLSAIPVLTSPMDSADTGTQHNGLVQYEYRDHRIVVDNDLFKWAGTEYYNKTLFRSIVAWLRFDDLKVSGETPVLQWNNEEISTAALEAELPSAIEYVSRNTILIIDDWNSISEVNTFKSYVSSYANGYSYTVKVWVEDLTTYNIDYYSLVIILAGTERTGDNNKNFLDHCARLRVGVWCIGNDSTLLGAISPMLDKVGLTTIANASMVPTSSFTIDQTGLTDNLVAGGEIKTVNALTENLFAWEIGLAKSGDYVPQVITVEDGVHEGFFGIEVIPNAYRALDKNIKLTVTGLTATNPCRTTAYGYIYNEVQKTLDMDLIEDTWKVTGTHLAEKIQWSKDIHANGEYAIDNNDFYFMQTVSQSHGFYLDSCNASRDLDVILHFYNTERYSVGVRILTNLGSWENIIQAGAEHIFIFQVRRGVDETDGFNVTITNSRKPARWNYTLYVVDPTPCLGDGPYDEGQDPNPPEPVAENLDHYWQQQACYQVPMTIDRDTIGFGNFNYLNTFGFTIKNMRIGRMDRVAINLTLTNRTSEICYIEFNGGAFGQTSTFGEVAANSSGSFTLNYSSISLDTRTYGLVIYFVFAANLVADFTLVYTATWTESDGTVNGKELPPFESSSMGAPNSSWRYLNERDNEDWMNDWCAATYEDYIGSFVSPTEGSTFEVKRDLPASISSVAQMEVIVDGNSSGLADVNDDGISQVYVSASSTKFTIRLHYTQGFMFSHAFYVRIVEPVVISTVTTGTTWSP